LDHKEKTMEKSYVEIIEEEEVTICRTTMEMPAETKQLLLEYAMHNMPVDTLDELRVEWAINKLLEEFVEAHKEKE
jgi:hypothetical protein